MRLWQGLRRFAEEKSPFGFLENHLRSVPPFQTASPGATLSGRLEKIIEHIIQAPNLTRWARIAIDQPYDYIYIIPWGICNHCVPSKSTYIYSLLSQKDFKHHSISYMLTVSLIHIFVTILDVEPLETYVRNQTNDDS